MTDRFLKMMPFIFEWEGGYDNDPDDPGGETKYGIDKRSHPREDIRNLTRSRAQEIYWEEYWQKYRCEDYPSPFGEVQFNCNVNCGNGRTQKIMETIPHGYPPIDAAAMFLNGQERFYHNLAAQRPVMGKYLKGWLNRTSALAKLVGLIRRGDGVLVPAQKTPTPTPAPVPVPVPAPAPAPAPVQPTPEPPAKPSFRCRLLDWLKIRDIFDGNS